MPTRSRHHGQRPGCQLAPAIIGVDIVIIGDIVAVIGGRRVDRHQPERIDAEVARGSGVAVVEVIQFLDDAIEVANAITIAVIKAAHENLIKDGFVPPRHAPRTGGGQRRWRRRDGKTGGQQQHKA
jgi:hypothetical protein